MVFKVNVIMMYESDSDDTYLVEETDETDVKSILCCFKRRESRRGFSVQSGDIQRTAPEEETDDVVDVNKLNFKEKILHIIHQTIYKVVKIFFSNFLPPLFTLLVFLLVIPLVLLLLAVFKYPPQLDLSLRSFQIPNDESSLNYDAFQMALNPYDPTSGESSGGTTRRKRYSECGPNGCCTMPQSYRKKSWTLDLYYVSKDGGNILTEDRLGQIHNIEQNVVKHRYGSLGYEDFCHKSEPYERCDPLNSLLTFFYPSVEGGKYVYDGNGDTLQDITTTLAAAFQIESSYWYGDFKKNNTESKYLRSQLQVGVPILGYCYFSRNVEAIHDKIADYFISFIPYLDSASTE